MADTELPDPVVFRPEHAAAAVGLSAEAGWNQIEADWAMMISLGRMVGLRGDDGAPVASALALPLGTRIGWISMVLVTAARRRQGLATRLVEDSARWLETQCIAPVLDATPAGEQVYARMGFERRLGLTRWQRPADSGETATGTGNANLRAVDPADLPWIAEVDRAVFGAERRDILADLLSRPGALALADSDRNGFLLSRAGRLATQIGPVSAEREETAVALLDAALARIPGPVFIDAFDDRAGFARHLRQRGFEVQRPFARMVRGAAPQFGDPARAFAAAGPELG